MINRILLGIAQLLVGPFMLIYMAGKWVVDGVKKIFTKK